MISISVILSLVGFTFTVVGTGVEYTSLPNLPWLDPSTIVAISGGDTLSVIPASRGPSVGLILNPVPEEGDTVFITADTL